MSKLITALRFVPNLSSAVAGPKFFMACAKTICFGLISIPSWSFMAWAICDSWIAANKWSLLALPLITNLTWFSCFIKSLSFCSSRADFSCFSLASLAECAISDCVAGTASFLGIKKFLACPSETSLMSPARPSPDTSFSSKIFIVVTSVGFRITRPVTRYPSLLSNYILKYRRIAILEATIPMVKLNSKFVTRIFQNKPWT